MLNIVSDIPWITQLPGRIEGFLKKDLLQVNIDGEVIRGYRSPDARSIWIRDYSDMLRGLQFFEEDVISVVSHFADTQAMNGRIFDYFTTFPEKLPCERENWTKYVRVPVESDVEFRFVKAAWLGFQAHGDSKWLNQVFPHLERALFYLMNHPQRWNENLGLVKRPYTIDTWDFAYTALSHDWLQFQIDSHTIWGIFFGDNSGLYESLILLSQISMILGKEEKMLRYNALAKQIKERTNNLCWNGRFYQHFIKEQQNEIPEFNELDQLSLSNPMTINRGLGSPAMAAAMLREYQSRADRHGFFAPWFSIDPPFPAGVFGDDKLIPGAYINGGLFPLVGGELALMALENGFEKYGLEQIYCYAQLVKNDETYLWYFPDGTPSSVETSTSPDATPSDGWGSTAFLHALIKGLAGITDLSHSFKHLRFTPRWPASGSKKMHMQISYAHSGAQIDCCYELKAGCLEYEIAGPFEIFEAELFIPEGRRVQSLLVNGLPIGFNRKELNGSLYACFKLFEESVVAIKVNLDSI